MTREQYLIKIQKDFDEGKISAEAYDLATMNIDEFCDDEEE